MGCSVDAHMRNYPRAITGFGNRQAHRTERPGVGVRSGWPRGGRPRPYGVRAWRPPGVLLTTHWQGMGVWRFAWSLAHTVSTPGCADRSGAWRSALAMGPTTVRVRHVPSPGGLLGIQRSTSFRNGPPGGCAASGWHASAVPCAATRRRLRRPWHRPPAAPSHRHKDLPARVADPPGGQRQAPAGGILRNFSNTCRGACSGHGVALWGRERADYVRRRGLKTARPLLLTAHPRRTGSARARFSLFSYPVGYSQLHATLSRCLSSYAELADNASAAVLSDSGDTNVLRDR